MSVEEANTLWACAWEALGLAAAVQAEHQAASEPTQRFLELLASAISSGRAHVTDERAAAPASPEAWGWQRRTMAPAGMSDAEMWMPQGRRVGWLTEEGLFLDPTAAHAVAQEIGLASGDPLAVGSKTLAKRLNERGLLVSGDRERRRLTTRRTFGKVRPNVWHLAPDA